MFSADMTERGASVAGKSVLFPKIGKVDVWNEQAEDAKSMIFRTAAQMILDRSLILIADRMPEVHG